MSDTPTKGFSWAERVKAPAGKSWDQVKTAFSKDAGEVGRMKGFARVGAVGLGAYIAKGALESRTADGEERSGLVRVGQAVLGTGIAAAGVLAGHGR